jgi:NADPH:quinone reductase-like Zn-dependent oxidoreductase
VGQAVTQLAAARGLRSVSLVRATADFAAVQKHLSALGASVVVPEEHAARHEVSKSLKDFAGAKLGLNSSGGAAAALVARALGESGTLVTFGAADRRAAITAPLDLFTAKDLTLKGFNLAKALAALPREARDAQVAAAVAAVASGSVRLLLARESFAAFDAALARAYTPGNARKIVLTF